MASQKMTKKPLDKIELVPYSKIDTESFENARTGAWTTSTGDEEVNSFEDLVKSIDAKGQTTAAFCRPNTGAKAKKQPYQLVAGFRRLGAFKVIAERDGSDPMVKIIVRELNDYEARALNLEENTARDNLTGPDLAWAIHDLSLKAIAAKVELSDVKLAEDQGISQAYGNRLLRIMRQVSPKITAAWRKAPIALTVPEMDSLTALSADPVKQKEAYDKLIGAKAEKNGDGKKPRGPGAWVDTAKTQASKIGEFLALAEDLELLALGDIKFDGSLVQLLESVGLVKFGKNEPTPTQLDKVAAAMQAAHAGALDKKAAAEAKAAETAAKPAKGAKAKAAAASASADN